MLNVVMTALLGGKHHLLSIPLRGIGNVATFVAKIVSSLFSQVDKQANSKNIFVYSHPILAGKASEAYREREHITIAVL